MGGVCASTSNSGVAVVFKMVFDLCEQLAGRVLLLVRSSFHTGEIAVRDGSIRQILRLTCVTYTRRKSPWYHESA